MPLHKLHIEALSRSVHNLARIRRLSLVMQKNSSLVVPVEESSRKRLDDKPIDRNLCGVGYYGDSLSISHVAERSLIKLLNVT